MPLDVKVLSNSIKSNLQAANLAASDTTMLSKFTNAIASAVVQHIKTEAVVSSENISVNGGAVPPGGGPIVDGIGILTDGKIT